MSLPFDVPRQAPQPPRATSREETWSLACVSCDVTVAAATRVALAGAVRDGHAGCVTGERVNVEYVVTTEATRQHPATRPHLMWLHLPIGLIHHLPARDAGGDTEVIGVDGARDYCA